MFSPSIQQAAVINWVATGKGSAFAEAVAGSGKTTTLVHALAATVGTVVFMAFNKAAATDIGEPQRTRKYLTTPKGHRLLDTVMKHLRQLAEQ